MQDSKVFTTEDQDQFASWSGDRNPMHVDPIVARRTQAGAPVVHGMHTLLWLLDVIARVNPAVAFFASLKVNFDKMVYVGDRVEAEIIRLTADGLRARALVEGVEVLNVSASCGCASPKLSDSIVPEYISRSSIPLDLSLEDIEGWSGRIEFAETIEPFAAAFPHVSRILGPVRLAAIACTTYLVGMVVPGLHSIYGALALKFHDDTDFASGMSFFVKSINPRFRRIVVDIAGGGVSGSLTTFARMPPISQASMNSIGRLVDPNEFKKVSALVIGGSRGLGEATAKIIAAGGGAVTITYATGLNDAESLATEIRGWGGRCEVLAYDVYKAAEPQLALLSEMPYQVYFFATPTIFKRKRDGFVAERLEEFIKFYVIGFNELINAGMRMRPEGISVFYPSSSAVSERPTSMTEYAMAKAAGEVLCADLIQYRRGLRILVERIPRVTTDQTASMVAIDSDDPLTVMLPIIRRMPH